MSENYDALLEQTGSIMLNRVTDDVVAEHMQKMASAIRALLVERDALQHELANEKARGIHTCHDDCQRPACVLRRERDALLADAERLEWIISDSAMVSWFETAKTGCLYFIEWPGLGEQQREMYPTPRAAIDAAIAKHKESR